jgi:hypothetical protein
MFHLLPNAVRLVPQIRPTSRKLTYFTHVPVKLLVGPISLPTTYTKKGTPHKHQPHPKRVGDIVWVSLREDGTLALYPFEFAGEGYELVKDAEEGVHFFFV